MSQRRRVRRAAREQQQGVAVNGDQSSTSEQLTGSQKARMGLALGMGVAVLLSGAAVWYRSRSRSKKPKKSKKNKNKSPRATAPVPRSNGVPNAMFAQETPREAPIVFSASGGGARGAGASAARPQQSVPAVRKTAAADRQGDSSPVDLLKQEAIRLKEKGNALFKQEKFVKAIDMYSAALELSPDEPSYHGNRALALMRLNQFDEALYDTERMVFLDPESAKALHLRGRTYFELGEYEHARDDFAESLKIKQTPAAQNGLADCEAKLKEESELAEKALAAHMAQEHPNLFTDVSSSAATIEVIEEEEAKEEESSWPPTPPTDSAAAEVQEENESTSKPEESDSTPTPSAFSLSSSSAAPEEVSTETDAASQSPIESSQHDDRSTATTETPPDTPPPHFQQSAAAAVGSTSATTENEATADAGVAVAAVKDGADEQGGHESAAEDDDDSDEAAVEDDYDSDEAAAISAAAFEDSDDDEVELASASADALIVEEVTVASADVIESKPADEAVAASASADDLVVEEVPVAADALKSKSADEAVVRFIPVAKDVPAENFDIVANSVSFSTDAVKDLTEESVAQKASVVSPAVNPEADIGTPRMSAQTDTPPVSSVALATEFNEASVSSPATPETNDSAITVDQTQDVVEESAAAAKPAVLRAASGLSSQAPVFVPGQANFNTQAPVFVPGQAFHLAVTAAESSPPAEPEAPLVVEEATESFVSPQEDVAGEIADSARSSSEFDTETAMAVADKLVAELDSDTDAAIAAAGAELDAKSSTDIDTDVAAELVAELDATTTSAPNSGSELDAAAAALDELEVGDFVSSGDSLLVASAAGIMQSAGDESGAGGLTSSPSAPSTSA